MSARTYLRCSRCGVRVSNDVITVGSDELVVRAYVECPDCTEKAVLCACGHPRRNHYNTVTSGPGCVVDGSCACTGFREVDIETLGPILLRFIERNLDDHGYVGLDLDGDPPRWTLTLDGKVGIADSEAEALRGVMNG